VIKSSATEIIKNPAAKKSVKEKKTPKEDNNDKSETPGKTLKRDLVKLALINMRNGIKKEVEGNAKTAKNLFDDELRYGMNVIGFKIPQCLPHARKL
jgi:hypothetical protein